MVVADNQWTTQSGLVFGIEILMFLTCFCCFILYEICRLCLCSFQDVQRRIVEKWGLDESQADEEEEEEVGSRKFEGYSFSMDMEHDHSRLDHFEEVTEEEISITGSTMRGQDVFQNESDFLSDEEKDTEDRKEPSPEFDNFDFVEEKKKKETSDRGYGMTDMPLCGAYKRSSSCCLLLFRVFAFIFNLSWVIYASITVQVNKDRVFLENYKYLTDLTHSTVVAYYYSSSIFTAIVLTMECSSVYSYDKKNPFCCMRFFEYLIRLNFHLAFVSCTLVTCMFWLVDVPVLLAEGSFEFKVTTFPMHGINAFFMIFELFMIFKVSFPVFLCCFTGSFPWVYLIFVTILVKTSLVDEYPYGGLISTEKNNYSIALRFLIGFSFCSCHLVISLLLFIRNIVFYCCGQDEDDERSKKEKKKKVSTIEYFSNEKEKKKETNLGIPNGYSLMASELHRASRSSAAMSDISGTASMRERNGVFESNNAGLISVNFQELENDEAESVSDEDASSSDKDEESNIEMETGNESSN